MRADENAQSTESRSAARSTVAGPPRSADLGGGLLALHSSAGNAAVVQLLRAAGHPWAQERHQHGAGCGHQQAGARPPVQRSAVHDVLSTSGRPLDDATRTGMESRFGEDFSGVRIHNDAAAKASAAEVGARAYTSGHHVVIGEDGGDQHTLAHELTHVIQQRRGPVAGTDDGAGHKVSDPSDRFEREAEAHAHRVMSGPVPHQQEQRPVHSGPRAAVEAGTVQRALTINGESVSGNFATDTANQNAADKKQWVDRTVVRVQDEIVRNHSAFAPAEVQEINAHWPALEEQLRKLIVSPVGEKGLNHVLGRIVGRNEQFGAKNRDVQVNDVVELARGLMGWVLAKGNRHEEKEQAKFVQGQDPAAPGSGIDIHLNSLLTKMSTKIDAYKSTIPPADAAVMEQELTTGLAHLDSQPIVVNPQTGQPERDPKKAGKPVGAYLHYFKSRGSGGHLQAGSLLATTVMERGGMQSVLRNPAQFTFRDKMMALHDLMEYFGEARHFPQTMGTQKFPEFNLQAQDTLSTSGFDAQGGRVTTTSRGQNPVRKPDGTTKEHPSTRNENDPTTRLARSHQRPVWAGQSFTAARMFRTAAGSGASHQELAAVAWGIFSFWRLDFDHTTAFAYHTLHEVMDIAQNFGVPYDIQDPYAGLGTLGDRDLNGSLLTLAARLTEAQANVDQGVAAFEQLRQDPARTTMQTDQEDAALDAMVVIKTGIDTLMNEVNQLSAAVGQWSTLDAQGQRQLTQRAETTLRTVSAGMAGLLGTYVPPPTT
ncbi:DUF4157 domain-containing protein [Streptomyces sp. NPDC048361]|uniref:eCIS core domain-containing protein n=1 Tax=Streptomyces sp. NPDC048361 TaxID=3154720 RepID=UPI0034402A79